MSAEQDAEQTPVEAVTPDRLTVRHVPERFRFEVDLDGQMVGHSEYRSGPGVRTFIHTIVDEQFRNRGVGEQLVQHALDQTSAEGLTVEPYCRFVRSFIAGHRGYLHLIPEDEREDFGLA